MTYSWKNYSPYHAGLDRNRRSLAEQEADYAQTRLAETRAKLAREEGLRRKAEYDAKVGRMTSAERWRAEAAKQMEFAEMAVSPSEKVMHEAHAARYFKFAEDDEKHGALIVPEKEGR